MKNQKFVVQFSVTTECSSIVNEGEVRRWAEEIFDGCDLGNVVVDAVSEVKKKRRAKKPKPPAAKRANQCVRACLPVCERDRAPGDHFCRPCREEERDYDRQAQNP